MHFHMQLFNERNYVFCQRGCVVAMVLMLSYEKSPAFVKSTAEKAMC